MQFTYATPHHLSKLHDELLAAVPALRPVTREDGTREAVMRIWGDGEMVTLEVPDELAQADIDAIEQVIANHDSAPLPPPPDPDEELAAAIRSATTLGELKQALLGETRPGRVAGMPVKE